MDHLTRRRSDISYLRRNMKFNSGSKTFFEADILLMNKQGFVTEYEVKTTFNDFMNDFTKFDGVRTQPLFNLKHKLITQTEMRTKHSIVLNGERVNRFYYVVSNEIYSKVERKVRSSFGFYVYKIDENGELFFTKMNNSPLYNSIPIPPARLEFYLVTQYRYEHKDDLNLKRLNDEQVFWDCIVNSDKYVPRLRKQKSTQTIREHNGATNK